jgi:hypothetical protein
LAPSSATCTRYAEDLETRADGFLQSSSSLWNEASGFTLARTTTFLWSSTMAIRDDDRPGRRPGLKQVSDASPLLPLIIGLIIAALLGWWLFTSTSTTDVGTTRTSAPTTNAGPDANRVPNPNSKPRQQ